MKIGRERKNTKIRISQYLNLPRGTDKFTTAGPTFAAALAIVSLPKHPQQGFVPSPPSNGADFFASSDGADSAEANLEKRNGKCPVNNFKDVIY